MTTRRNYSTASRIVVLTGAGISRESGLHTFRDPDGLWARVRVEDVATPEAFERDPGRVHAFYNQRRAQLWEAILAPNEAHLALVRLERAVEAAGGEFHLITQNVDNLHERAGSRNLLHMHGELAARLCAACGWREPWPNDLDISLKCPVCAVSGALRPDIVWFGEMPYHMERIGELVERAELFLSIGTSGTVYPAAGFAAAARSSGARTVELNLEQTAGRELFHNGRYGPATEVVPDFVEELLKGWSPA